MEGPPGPSSSGPALAGSLLHTTHEPSERLEQVSPRSTPPATACAGPRGAQGGPGGRGPASFPGRWRVATTGGWVARTLLAASLSE